jgi:hypothetical protein
MPVYSSTFGTVLPVNGGAPAWSGIEHGVLAGNTRREYGYTTQDDDRDV